MKKSYLPCESITIPTKVHTMNNIRDKQCLNTQLSTLGLPTANPTHHDIYTPSNPYPYSRYIFTGLTDTIIIYNNKRCLYDLMFISTSCLPNNIYLIPQEFMLLIPYMFS